MMNREKRTLARLGNAKLEAVVELGRVELSLREVNELRVGDVLQSNSVEDVDLRLNGVLFAKGEITHVYRDRHFRVDELVGLEQKE